MGLITLDDTLKSSVVKLSAGNPGALTVLMALVKETPVIDPAAGLGGLHYILRLDDLGLCGPSIWKLFKDVCDSKIEGVIALLRGNQLGVLSEAELLNIIRNDKPVDVTPLIEKIRAELPSFAQPVTK